MTDDGLEATLRALSASKGYTPTSEDVQKLLAGIAVSGNANESVAVVAGYFRTHWGIETAYDALIAEFDLIIKTKEGAVDALAKMLREAAPPRPTLRQRLEGFSAPDVAEADRSVWTFRDRLAELRQSDGTRLYDIDDDEEEDQ